MSLHSLQFSNCFCTHPLRMKSNDYCFSFTEEKTGLKCLIWRSQLISSGANIQTQVFFLQFLCFQSITLCSLLFMESVVKLWALPNLNNKISHLWGGIQYFQAFADSVKDIDWNARSLCRNLPKVVLTFSYKCYELLPLTQCLILLLIFRILHGKNM